VHKLVKVFSYRGGIDVKGVPQNELLYHAKRGNRRDINRFIAEEICDNIGREIKIDKDSFIITSVPRQKSRRAKYGVDHSAEIAKNIGRILKIPFVPILKSTAKSPQKKTSGEMRYINATFDYKHKPNMMGKTVLIFDDIVTTGASMGACATLIRGLSPKKIIGLTFAVAFKNN
jgi:ComF family protein